MRQINPAEFEPESKIHYILTPSQRHVTSSSLGTMTQSPESLKKITDQKSRKNVEKSVIIDLKCEKNRLKSMKIGYKIDKNAEN